MKSCNRICYLFTFLLGCFFSCITTVSYGQIKDRNKVQYPNIPYSVLDTTNFKPFVLNAITGERYLTDWPTFGGGGGAGTVTSVSSGNLSPLFTSSVATATTTPAISYSLSNASAYTLFGRNSGTSGTPAYFTPTLASALFANQGTTTTVLHGNASGNPSWGAVSLTADVSGILGAANGGTGNGFTAFTGPTTATKTFTLPNSSATILTSASAVTAAQGGTGQTSYAVGDVLYASSTSSLSKLAAGTSGYVFTSNGPGTAPSWQAVAAGISLTTTGTSGAATYSGGTLNVPVYLSAGDRSFFDSTKAGQIYDSIEVSLINSQDVYLKRKSYGSSTWDSAFQFTIPNTSAWDSVIRTTLTTTSTTGDFSNATLSRIVNVPNSTAGTYRIEATCNDGSGHFFTSIKIGHYYKSSGGTLTVGTASAMVTDINSGLPSETALTIVNSGDNLAFTVTTGTVTAVATGYWKINICLTSNDGPAF